MTIAPPPTDLDGPATGWRARGSCSPSASTRSSPPPAPACRRWPSRTSRSWKASRAGSSSRRCAADAPPAALAAAVLRAVDGAPAAPDAVERERASAEEAFRLLRVLLARGRSEEAVDVDGLALRPEEWLG